MPEPRKGLDYFIQMDPTVLIWMVGAIVALIFVVIVAHLLRGLFATRVRQVQEFGMDFDAVADMLEKGLLTADEVKRVKSVLTRHFARLYDQRLGGQTTADLAAEAGEADASLPAPQGSRPQTGSAKVAAVSGPSPPQPAPPAARETPANAPADEDLARLPLDILDMYRMGMISDEELAALRRFYAARARGSK